MTDGSREKLIDVAIQLFAQKGLEGVSTRDLASAAGVNISLISYYFGGKEGLYRTAIQEFAEKAKAELDHMMSTVDTQTLTAKTYVAVMNEFVNKMAEFKLKSPHMHELMMREMISGLPHLRDVYENLFRSVASQIVNFMTIAQQKKIIRSDLNTATLFLTMAHSVDVYFLVGKCDTTMAHQALCTPQDYDKYVQQIVKIFVEGVLV